MHNRADMLDRLRAALARPGVDGLLATADIAEDPLLPSAPACCSASARTAAGTRTS